MNPKIKIYERKWRSNSGKKAFKDLVFKNAGIWQRIDDFEEIHADRTLPKIKNRNNFLKLIEKPEEWQVNYALREISAEKDWQRRELELEKEIDRKAKIVRKDLQYVSARSKVALGADPRACCHLFFREPDYGDATNAYFKTRRGIEGHICLWQKEDYCDLNTAVNEKVRPLLKKFNFPRNFKIYKSDVDPPSDLFKKDFYKEYIYSIINI